MTPLPPVQRPPPPPVAAFQASLMASTMPWVREALRAVAETVRGTAEVRLVSSKRRRLPALRLISPVCALPRVSDCLAVVVILPSASKTRARAEEPEIEAVGVPEATLRKANLAEAVAVAPRRTSSVVKTGARAPLFLCQLPTIVGSVQVALPPLSEVRT